VGDFGLVRCGLLATLYLSNGPNSDFSRTDCVTLARLTCPVVFASFYFHFGFGFYYWVLLANAAVDALVGLIAETLRQPTESSKIIPKQPTTEFSIVVQF
jgi:hypothetical protein